MLTLLTQEKRCNKTVSGGIVLNTEFITELQITETTKTKFKFCPKPEDRRGGVDTFTVTEQLVAIRTEANKSFTAIMITLNVFPDNDNTKTSVATVFNNKEIIMAYPNDRTDRTECYIEINEKGWNPKRYLVEHYYVDIAALAETGTTTSTTTTSTSTSTTSSSTT